MSDERARLEAHEAHYLASDARMRRLLLAGGFVDRLLADRRLIEELAEVLGLLLEVREELREWKAELAARDGEEPRGVPS